MRRDITLLAAGQALIRKRIQPIPDPGFEELVRTIRTADIAFTNFEGAILGESSCWPTKDSFCSAVPPDTLDSLVEMGFSSLALANNHAFDLGPGGVLATLAEVKRRAFLHAGTGINSSTAASPAFRDYSFGRVAMIAMHTGYKNELRTCRAMDEQPRFGIPARPGINCIEQIPASSEDYVFGEDDVTRNLQSIAEAAKASDFVIVYIHHHTPEKHPGQPPPSYRSLCRRCIESGANIVIGHGTPVFQGIEIYEGRPMLFNVANLIFHTQAVEMWSSRHGLKPWESFLVSARFQENGTISSLEALPVILGDPGLLVHGSSASRWDSYPAIAYGNRGESIVKRLCELSSEYGVCFTPEIRGPNQWKAVWGGSPQF